MKRRNKQLPPYVKGLVILFWLLVWQLLSYAVKPDFLVASPLQVAISFGHLCLTQDFWLAIGFSFYKISLGFFIALIVGCLLAVFSYRSALIKELLMPIIKLFKSTPVVSFIILAILWFGSGYLATLVSFLMVLPVIYLNVLQGLDSTDEKMLEMAYVFRLSLIKRIKYLYIPAVMPYFVTACSLGLGFSWKSGIAAEVIGQPTHSIGSELYVTKLYFMTPELFVWTAVIILVSSFFEKLIMFFLHALARKLS